MRFAAVARSASGPALCSLRVVVSSCFAVNLTHFVQSSCLRVFAVNLTHRQTALARTRWRAIASSGRAEATSLHSSH
jgi:hypothetical protein